MPVCWAFMNLFHMGAETTGGWLSLVSPGSQTAIMLSMFLSGAPRSRSSRVQVRPLGLCCRSLSYPSLALIPRFLSNKAEKILLFFFKSIWEISPLPRVTSWKTGAWRGSQRDKQWLTLESFWHLNSHVAGHVSAHWVTWEFSPQLLTAVLPANTNNTLP